MTETKYGVIGWHDLTVPNATAVRDFYAAVLGLGFQETSMGDYSDYTLVNDAGEPLGGVCHARGQNTGMPAQWVCYVNVRDLDAALKACVATGGRIYREKKAMGDYGDFAVIQDPAGAVMGLIQPK